MLHGRFTGIQIATEQQATLWKLWVKVVPWRPSFESISHYLNIAHTAALIPSLTANTRQWRRAAACRQPLNKRRRQV